MSKINSLNFKLDVDDDGWPPVSSESIPVEEVDCKLFKILKPPLFIGGLSVGDVVAVESDETGFVNAHRIEIPSNNSTYWAIVPNRTEFHSLLEALLICGCNVESLEQFNLMAIDVPGTVNVRAVEQALIASEQKGTHIAEPSLRPR